MGRFLLQGDATVWQDGPLSRAVKQGAICYLDEIVEARKDSTVLIHSLTDHRRILPVEKMGIILDAHTDFLLVISYNPGYQNVLRISSPVLGSGLLPLTLITRNRTRKQKLLPTRVVWRLS